MNAVDEKPWTDTSWNDAWNENGISNFDETYIGENDETSWPDEWYVGNVDFGWWYDDWDWISWDDDWSRDQSWNSSWNGPTSSSPPTRESEQNFGYRF